MMKIRKIVLGLLLSSILTSGCGNSKVDEIIQNQEEKEESISTDSAEKISVDMENPNKDAENKPANMAEPVKQEDIQSGNDLNNVANNHCDDSNIIDIDLDLTTMSSTMVYSEVYNIMCYPDEYREKCIKMSGTCSIFEDVVTGQLYYACIIQDATQCCQQGIEFNLQDSYIYPDDYPENGEEVTVVGIFETYAEDGVLYCRLRDAVLCD